MGWPGRLHSLRTIAPVSAGTRPGRLSESSSRTTSLVFGSGSSSSSLLSLLVSKWLRSIVPQARYLAPDPRNCVATPSRFLQTMCNAWWLIVARTLFSWLAMHVRTCAWQVSALLTHGNPCPSCVEQLFAVSCVREHVNLRVCIYICN